jgi:Protein of unknown function (DUF3631)
MEDPTLGELVLRHIREAFDQVGRDRISTVELLHLLVERDDAPWAAWWGRDVEEGRTKGPASRLSRILKEFEISPMTVRIGDETLRGYYLSAFEEPWARYLQSPVSLRTAGDTQQRNDAGQSRFPANRAENAQIGKSPRDQGGCEVASEKRGPSATGGCGENQKRIRSH